MGVPICNKCIYCNTLGEVNVFSVPNTNEDFPTKFRGNNKNIQQYTEKEIKEIKKKLNENIKEVGGIIINNESIFEIIQKINPDARKIKIPDNILETIDSDYIEGPLIKFKNGEFYQGGWDSNRQRFGYGISINEQGNIFKGLWEGDYFGKYGAFIEKNGNYYIGQLNKGVAEGKGEMVIKNKMKYNGEFNNDLPHGQGVLENIVDNTVYNGKMNYGLKEGKGEMKYIDGTNYVGEFKKDKFDGRGKMKFSNGNIYEGEFKNGKMNGNGEFMWKDGKKHIGGYVDNVKQGHGKLVWDENKYYEGNWFNNKLHGEGIFHIDGKSIKVKFRFGKIIMKEDEV